MLNTRRASCRPLPDSLSGPGPLSPSPTQFSWRQRPTSSRDAGPGAAHVRRWRPALWKGGSGSCVFVSHGEPRWGESQPSTCLCQAASSERPARPGPRRSPHRLRRGFHWGVAIGPGAATEPTPARAIVCPVGRGLGRSPPVRWPPGGGGPRPAAARHLAGRRRCRAQRWRRVREVAGRHLEPAVVSRGARGCLGGRGPTSRDLAERHLGSLPPSGPVPPRVSPWSDES